LIRPTFGCPFLSSFGALAEAERIGFPGVLAGPLVRSSYRAGRLYQQAIEARGLTRPS